MQPYILYVHTVYVHNQHPANRIHSTAQAWPISLLMSFFCLHPIANFLFSIESSLQFFTCLWFNIFVI